ncbi:MFS transporter [Candidatus Entotheonella palauensis]|uniref:MFS transporter n=1 Tax=Candidatus Entotheonella palauensis TaxID=93172 RepID=UPI0015C4AAAF|nr:MFS transporter [Candidatus Entotheonella palauensis]
MANRNYLLLWLAQIISGLGDVLYNVGVMVTIFNHTGSALQAAGVLVATSVPSVIFGPLAGALVDRYPRQSMLITVDIIRALLVAVLLLVLRDEALNVWVIYLIIAGLATATTFYQPARQAMIPSIVPPDDLASANSLLIGANQATLAAGFLAGSLLVLIIPLRLMVLIDLITFIIAAILITFIRPATLNTAATTVEARPSLWQSIRDGAGYLQRHQVARPLVVMEIAEHVPHAIWTSALLLVFAEQALNGGPREWGSIVSAFFSGQLIGALIAAFWTRGVEKRPGWIIIGSAAVFGILTGLFALSATLAIALTLSMLFGPPASIRDVAQNTLLQTSVADDMLGRVYALRGTFMSLTFMLSGVVFAGLADFIPIRAIYLIGSGLYLATAIYALTSRALRQSTIEPEVVCPDADSAFCHCLENAKRKAAVGVVEVESMAS